MDSKIQEDWLDRFYTTSKRSNFFAIGPILENFDFSESSDFGVSILCDCSNASDYVIDYQIERSGEVDPFKTLLLDRFFVFFIFLRVLTLVFCFVLWL